MKGGKLRSGHLGGHNMTDVVSGALLGVLLGSLIGLFAPVDQVTPFLVTGGILFGSLGLLNWLKGISFSEEPDRH